MAFEFKLPDIGEGVVEGEIVKWHVAPGDAVAEDQPMVEVMTDKATVVIPSPRAGTILETRGKEGDITKVGGVLVVIEEVGAKGTAAKPPRAEASPPSGQRPAAAAASARNDVGGSAKGRVEARPPAGAGRAEAGASGQAMDEHPAASASPAPRRQAAAQPRGGRESRDGMINTRGEMSAEGAAPLAGVNGNRPVLAAPATRRLARELGVELARLEGTGPGGRVTSEDVRRATTAADVAGPAEVAPIERARSAARPAAVEPELMERVPVRALRKRIWENMARSKAQAAHFTFVEECDCSQLVDLRERFNARLLDGESKLSYLPFIVKAVVAALRQFPDLNGHVDEQALEFVRRRDFHVGIAAATDRGLIVPVVRNADRRSLLDLAREIKRLGDAARESKIGMEDLGGSTFTITSLGKDGGIFATPIINHPEVAILGVHKLNRRAVVEEDGLIVAKPMMNLSLSFDHRLIDGHVGAAFTYAVIRLLESPDRLLMEMS